MIILKRLKKALFRYQWRFPFIAAHWALAPLGRVPRIYRIMRLAILNKASIGRGTVIEQGVRFTPRSTVSMGSRVFIGKNCTFEIVASDEASVAIGDRTWVSLGCLIQANSHLSIGRNVLIGEYVSIRDTQHQFAKTDVPMKDQGDTVGKVTIENDVWIGRGSLILGRPEGIVIGHGSIIAANSVIHRSIPPYTIWGGVPGRQIAQKKDKRE